MWTDKVLGMWADMKLEHRFLTSWSKTNRIWAVSLAVAWEWDLTVHLHRYTPRLQQDHTYSIRPHLLIVPILLRAIFFQTTKPCFYFLSLLNQMESHLICFRHTLIMSSILNFPLFSEEIANLIFLYLKYYLIWNFQLTSQSEFNLCKRKSDYMSVYRISII